MSMNSMLELHCCRLYSMMSKWMLMNKHVACSIMRIVDRDVDEYHVACAEGKGLRKSSHLKRGVSEGT